MRDGPWKLVWPMREGGDRKCIEDNDFYQAGLTSSHRLMPATAELPDYEIGPTEPPELYKVDVDPHEDHDLAATDPARVDTMIQAWDAWFADVTDGWQTTFQANNRQQEQAEQAGPGDA